MALLYFFPKSPVGDASRGTQETSILYSYNSPSPRFAFSASLFTSARQVRGESESGEWIKFLRADGIFRPLFASIPMKMFILFSAGTYRGRPGRTRRVPTFFLLFAFSLLLTGAGRAQEANPLPDGALETATREKIFEIVWSRVNEKYFDPTFGGVDWNLMRRRYLPKSVEAKTDGAFYALLNQMLGELKQSHFGVSPPEGLVAEIPTAEKKPVRRRTSAGASSGEGGRGGTAGLTVQMVEGRPTITQVTQGGAAQTANLRPGFLLTAVDGKPVEEILERLKKRSAEEGALPTYVRLVFDSLLSGPVGSEVAVEYLDANDTLQKAVLQRRKTSGTMTTFGALPPLPVRVEKRRLEGNFGYIGFNIFLIPILEPVRAAAKELHDTNGMILDLRGNPGGMGAIAPAVAALFLSQKTNLGQMKMRDGDLKFPVYPAEKPYLKPLVILTDEGSVSTSEILAASLQERGRAAVIGSRSAGMALPSQVEDLPGGGKLQFAFADFRTLKGKLIEGRGVLPDVPVTLTRAALLESRDPILDAALQYLKTSSQR